MQTIANNPNYTSFVNKTYSKPFSKRQSLPNIVSAMEKPGVTILDFGSGKDIFGTRILRDKGFDCTAWDIGANYVKDVHDYHALDQRYDVVMVSNVMNVQPSGSDVAEILLDVQGVLNDTGRLYCNFPDSPRHNDMSNDAFESALRLFAHTHNNYGGSVEQIKRGVWKCVYKR